MLLISAGMIFLELFHMYQEIETKGMSCQNCKMFAGDMAGCSAPLCLSCQSNATTSEGKGRLQTQTEEFLGPELQGPHCPRLRTARLQNWCVLDTGLHEGRVCRRVLASPHSTGCRLTEITGTPEGCHQDITISSLKKHKTKQYPAGTAPTCQNKSTARASTVLFCWFNP